MGLLEPSWKVNVYYHDSERIYPMWCLFEMNRSYQDVESQRSFKNASKVRCQQHHSGYHHPQGNEKGHLTIWL